METSNIFMTVAVSAFFAGSLGFFTGLRFVALFAVNREKKKHSLEIFRLNDLINSIQNDKTVPDVIKEQCVAFHTQTLEITKAKLAALQDITLFTY